MAKRHSGEVGNQLMRMDAFSIWLAAFCPILFYSLAFLLSHITGCMVPLPSKGINKCISSTHIFNLSFKNLKNRNTWNEIKSQNIAKKLIRLAWLAKFSIDKKKCNKCHGKRVSKYIIMNSYSLFPCFGNYVKSFSNLDINHVCSV